MNKASITSLTARNTKSAEQCNSTQLSVVNAHAINLSFFYTTLHTKRASFLHSLESLQSALSVAGYLSESKVYAEDTAHRVYQLTIIVPAEAYIEHIVNIRYVLINNPVTHG